MLPANASATSTSADPQHDGRSLHTNSFQSSPQVTTVLPVEKEGRTSPTHYTVRAKDVPGLIAECFKVSLTDLLALNNLGKTQPLAIGQILRLPDGASPDCQGPQLAPDLDCDILRNRDLADLAPQCVHTVKSGETMGTISAHYGVPVSILRELNGCKGDTILVDQKMKLCSAKKTPSQPVHPAPPPPPPLTPTPPQTLILPPPPRPVPACKSIIGRNPKGDDRIVFLSNGNAVALFEKYVGETKRAGIPTEWDKLVVVLFSEKGQEHFRGAKPDFGETLAGLTTVGKWKKTLRGRFAACRPDPIGDANALGSDMVCEPSQNACK